MTFDLWILFANEDLEVPKQKLRSLARCINRLLFAGFRFLSFSKSLTVRNISVLIKIKTELLLLFSFFALE